MDASIGRPGTHLSGTDDDGVVARHLPLPSIEAAGCIDFGTSGHGERSASRALSSPELIFEVHQVYLRMRGDL